MIEITDGISSIRIATDETAPPSRNTADARELPRGARVTLEFWRDAPLPPDRAVRVRYEFAGGTREVRGIAQPTRTVTRWGHGVVYHYRLSHWIAPAAPKDFVAGNVRHRTEEHDNLPQHPEHQTGS